MHLAIKFLKIAPDRVYLSLKTEGHGRIEKNVYEWIRNPSAFIVKNEYARNLKKNYGLMMTGFPELTNEEIDAICNYIDEVEKTQKGIPIAVR